jgi:opacity protein-like surface antigen
MGQTRLLITALALVLCQTAGAMAADLGLPPPPPVTSEPMVVPAPVASPACCDRGWYFEGFLGTTYMNVDHLANPAYSTADFTMHNTGFESSGFGGLGVGYKLNRFLRFDTTGEFRGKSTFHALDSYVGYGYSGTDDYTATLKSWDWLANMYWDIACWNGFTPYVGAGIGYARNYIGDYTDVNVPNLGVAYAKTHAEGSLAWALHAGVSYAVNDRVSLDLSYRYLNLGDAISDTIIAYDGSGTATGLQFKDIDSQDMMLGVRWKFGGGCCEAPVMPVALK